MSTLRKYLTSKKVVFFATAIITVATAGCTSSQQDESVEPDGSFPGFSGWVPSGARNVGSYDYNIIPQPDSFHTFHSGTNNSDNVWVAVAPKHELDWVAETAFFIPEGPTYDNEGNLYFSPLFPQVSPTSPEDVSLISLDAETGERNWEIVGDGRNAGGGAPLVLNDPGNPGKQIIYHMTYTEAMAIRPSGEIIWRVPTGLALPPIVPGEVAGAHSFGLNYHPATDSVVGITSGADILAFDRKTGSVVASPEIVPGAPAISDDGGPNWLITELADRKTDEVFGVPPGGVSFFSLILNAIFGGGSVVTNYFAIDPNTSRIFIAATAEDDVDGTVDGRSEIGAIYALELVKNDAGKFNFDLVNAAYFQGGTGSTPSVSEDGQYVYVSDNLGNVIALDRDLNERWRADVGSPIAASVAVSPDNNELYAVTATDVFQLVDEGDSGRVVWKSEFGAFSDNLLVDVEVQALTPTISANGIAVSVGGARRVLGDDLMIVVGMGLLDRSTGKLKSFTQGREESIAVSSVAADGSIYTAGSPVRRVVANALLPGLVEPIIGGISRYKPINNELLARDAACAASARAINASTLPSAHVASAREDVNQIQVLLNQAEQAVLKAKIEGSIDNDLSIQVKETLVREKQQITVDTLAHTGRSLYQVCQALGGENESLLEH